MGEILQLSANRKPSLLQCSACGAEANASCNCGVPYVPAAERAAAALARNPQMSDRSIASLVGVDRETVGRARKVSTGGMPPVGGKRIGKDGKLRKLPQKAEPQTCTMAPAAAIAPIETISAFHQELIAFLTDYTTRFKQAAPPIGKEDASTWTKRFDDCARMLVELSRGLNR